MQTNCRWCGHAEREHDRQYGCSKCECECFEKEQTVDIEQEPMPRPAPDRRVFVGHEIDHALRACLVAVMCRYHHAAEFMREEFAGRFLHLDPGVVPIPLRKGEHDRHVGRGVVIARQDANDNPRVLVRQSFDRKRQGGYRRLRRFEVPRVGVQLVLGSGRLVGLIVGMGQVAHVDQHRRSRIGRGLRGLGNP